jgi:hypothetical protein
LLISAELITSTGDGELVTVRSLRRVPVMTIWSLGGGGTAAGLAACAKAGSGAAMHANVVAEARRKVLKLRDLAMISPDKKHCSPHVAVQQQHE